MISPLTPSLAMNLVPHSLVYLSLSVSWSILTVAILPIFAIRDQVPCTASIDPQHGVARQFDGDSVHEVIRCSARISKEHRFTHPVFDISFGQTPLKGIFILRGSSQCSSNKELCWSDFRIPRQALRQLLLPSVEANSIANAGDTSSASEVTHSSAISFTCNIADTSGNRTVRCLDNGTIRYANGKCHTSDGRSVGQSRAKAQYCNMPPFSGTPCNTYVPLVSGSDTFRLIHSKRLAHTFISIGI